MKDVFIRNKAYTGPVQAVILDWAGTAVDYGSMGPTAVIGESFAVEGVAVTMDEVRAFMGLKKIDHVRAVAHTPSVVEKWRAVHGRVPDESDVIRLYEITEPLMLRCIGDHGELIPGLLDTVEKLRTRGVKIGSSTGYTRAMMDRLIPVAASQGYIPDAVFCPTDVPAGRPYPWMCYQNAVALQVYPMEAMVKIGDTTADVEEGLNAGMWIIGLTQSGNELGLPRAEVEALDPAELDAHIASIEIRFRALGAHYTARGIWEVLPILDDIEARLARGERPL